MNDDLLREILEQLKIQTQLSQESLARLEQAQKEIHERSMKASKKTGQLKHYLIILIAALVILPLLPSLSAIPLAVATILRNEPRGRPESGHPSNLQQSRILLESGQCKEVVIKRDDLEKRFPNDPDTYFILGSAFFDCGELSKAEAMFKKSDSLLPDARNATYLSAIHRRSSTVPDVPVGR